MSITPTYPGIYIQELPSSSHTIIAAPTSIAVFIGYSHPFKTKNFGTPVEIFSFNDFESQFGGFSSSNALDGNLARSVNDFFLNGGSHAYVVGLQPQHYSTSTGANQDPGTATSKSTPPDLIAAQTWTIGSLVFTALEPTDLVQIAITINNLQKTVNDNDTADITVSYGNRTEVYRKVLITAIAGAINGVSSLIKVSVTPPAGGGGGGGGGGAANPAFTAYPPTSGQPAQPLPPAGTNGVFFQADFNNVFQADGLLDKLPVFNLMAIPGIVNNHILSEALAFSERKLAFFIMDPPVKDVADQITGTPWIGGFIQTTGDGDAAGNNIAPLSTNGALYFPYLNSLDPLSGVAISNPPSGYIAGVYARTDTNRGVWKAPAGLETLLIDTTGVAPTGRMTDNRHGVLNQLGVNCIRDFPTGTVVFGARTLVGADSNTAFQQWKYVPVRRMTLFIEQSLYMNLKWVVFEPNDTPLWVSIRTTINNFMMTLFNQGAFQGSTPSLAFQVKCDSTTTTQTDIDNGIVNIIVAFAPLKPAEFVIIKIAQLAGQAQ